MKLKLTALLFSFASLLQAQVTDNFSDGDFTSNPVWTGNDTDYIVNPTFQLQLNSTGQDTSYLVTPNTYTLNDCEWNFWIRLNFSPSASNNAKVYLVSDQQNLQGSLNGYFLQFGEALSNDQVELFRQNGTTTTSVCRGTTLIANAFSIRVKVIRDNAGLWTLSIDPTGGYNFTQEASGTDVTFTSTSFFGLNSLYTSSNSNKVYLDDVYVGSIQVDSFPPSLDSINVISQTQLDLIFNEPLESVTSQTASNYLVPSIGIPVSAVLDGSNPAKVHLTFGSLFPPNTVLTLLVQNVEDLNGNAVNSSGIYTFNYYVPASYDLIVSEIMADPDPPVSLPNYEYLEIYNSTGLVVKIKNWSIRVGNTTRIIPTSIIYPDSFLVLTSTSAVSSFSPNISITGISSFPSITNTGNTITLYDSTGKIIHSVTYDDSWYQDAMKEDGGYSLEMIDLNNPCAGQNNWKASNSPIGGTPGLSNSISGSNPDNTVPGISRVSVINTSSIQVYFTEPVDSVTSTTLSAYTVNNGIGQPFFANAVEPSYASVILQFTGTFLPNTIYTLTLSGTITDCAGNTASTSTSLFAIPEVITPGDIIINEILPDPYDGGVEWVEIYNPTNKVFDLNDLFLCSQDTVTGVLQSTTRISNEGFLIFPGTHLVLSTSTSGICNFYPCPAPNNFVPMSSIPSQSNDGDAVVLADSAGVIIDRLVYAGDWHFPLLNSTKGVSLERISYTRPTQDRTNWHSAAETAGFATPGTKNSQHVDDGASGDVTITPEIFSPDNDGNDDVVSFSFTFEKSGFVGNIRIFDSRGRLIRTLWNNELLGSTATVSWDGISNDGAKGTIGIYVLYFEGFHADGEVRKVKKAFVLAGKL